MVTLDAHINGENSEDLKVKPFEYFFCLKTVISLKAAIKKLKLLICLICFLLS